MERLSCSNQDACPLRETQRGCFEDTHHIFFPRAAYRSPVEKQFRELDENKVEMCRAMHDLEHAAIEAPDKPDVQLMHMAVTEARNRRLNGLA